MNMKHFFKHIASLLLLIGAVTFLTPLLGSNHQALLGILAGVHGYHPLYNALGRLKGLR